MKQRALIFLLTASLLLTACSTGGGLASSTGRVDPPAESVVSSTAQSASAPEYRAEFPSAEAELPGTPEQTQAPAGSMPLDELLVIEPTSTGLPVRSVTVKAPEEVSAVWISYLEFLRLAQNQTKASFTANMDSVFKTTADYGLNTVFVQVRPFGDALYKSNYFPWSYVLTGTEGNNPGYDPLAIMVELARKHDLRIEAWLNPYRVRASAKAASANPISTDNRAVAYLQNGSDAVIQYDGGVYYNPASKTARDLITMGVIEIVQNYDVDGIHFDDYFYPTTNAAFDASYYSAFVNGGGQLSLGDWRRENVNTLVRQVYVNIKHYAPDVIFGISPQARVDVNYGSQYADVEKWLSTPGYVDYICPQIYFGFDHETVPYNDCLDQWNRMAAKSGVDLYVGLAVYKSGVADNGAKSGKTEWQTATDLLKRMVQESRKRSEYAGFVLYRYDSLFAPVASVSNHIAQERQNLATIID